MFDTQYKQYNEFALAVDLVAERIRSLGFTAPGNYSEFASHSSIRETSGAPEAKEMIQLLVKVRKRLSVLHDQFLQWLKRRLMKQLRIY